MADDRAVLRNKKWEKLDELKEAAIVALELRGYEVRGKSPAQVREILKRRPKKPVSNAAKDAARQL